MRMAEMPLPTGNGLHDAHETLRRRLTEAFGGYTSVPGYGGWRDPASGTVYEEPVIVYRIAMEPRPENDLKLDSIAQEVGHAAHQIAVLVQYASGETHIVNVTE